MMTAANWFTDEAELRRLCGDAQSQAFGERAQEFANRMVAEAKENGLAMRLSLAQLSWLCRIADWNVPPRVAP